MSWKRLLQFLMLAGAPTAACAPEPPPPTTDVDEPQDSDAQTIAQLVLAGSDLSQPHPVEFWLYLPTQPAADASAEALRGHVDEVEVRLTAKGSEWLCLAKKSFVPTLPEIHAMRSRMEALAREHGGEFDGWEAAVVRRK